MALKTTTANALQHGHRRRVNKPVLVRGSQLSARYITERRMKHERKIRKQQQKQQEQRIQQEEPAASSATATPEPSTPPSESTSFHGMSAEKKEALQHILGRTLDEKDRSAADILATLYMTGLLDRKTPAASEASGASTPIHESDAEPTKITLPSMQQTEVMLEVWRSERSGVKSSAVPSSEAADAEHTSALLSSPMTPALSASSTAMASARSSFSLGSPVSQYAHMPSPSGPPPPPYDAWRKSIAVAHGDAAPVSSASAPLPAPIPTTSKVTQSPFSTYEQNYFCSSRNSSNNNQEASGPNGMPSPPQSPTDAGRPRDYSYKPAAPTNTLPTLPSIANLPTPPQSFSASMQPASYHQQAYHPHNSYQPRYHSQYELPAPMPTHRRSIHGGAEDIATTVVTLPAPGIGSSREPLTPVSPLTLPSAFGRRSTMPTMPSVATMINGPYHHNSPRMAAKMDARRDRISSVSSPSTISAPKKAMPKPHCNVKYETAELDFIMYQRTTKNRAWDDVTASFNAALPRLRQYADIDCARLGGAVGPAGSTSPGGADKMDRYRARPERTTPGLQASYYRQRLALPLLDESGQLVFDDASNKQLFTEVMVRDDKSRKKLRRMTTGPTAVAPTAAPSSSSKVNPDDARVHLVLYFPERVTYYDYWFVSEEDKALARQRTYERNMQRHQRGLPAWHPGNDDPDSGILVRGKD